MKRIEITDKDILEELKRFKKQGRSQQQRTRSHAILLSNGGKEINEIAVIFDVTQRTVYHWFEAWEQRGLDSVFRKKGDGRKPLLNADKHKEIIKKNIEENPHKPKKAYALTLDELHISISYKTFQRFLKKHLI
jgi:transposase